MCAITFVIQHCVVCISSVLKRLYILALLAQQYVCVCVCQTPMLSIETIIVL